MSKDYCEITGEPMEAAISGKQPTTNFGKISSSSESSPVASTGDMLFKIQQCLEYEVHSKDAERIAREILDKAVKPYLGVSVEHYLNRESPSKASTPMSEELNKALKDFAEVFPKWSKTYNSNELYNFMFHEFCERLVKAWTSTKADNLIAEGESPKLGELLAKYDPQYLESNTKTWAFWRDHAFYWRETREKRIAELERENANMRLDLEWPIVKERDALKAELAGLKGERETWFKRLRQSKKGEELVEKARIIERVAQKRVQEIEGKLAEYSQRALKAEEMARKVVSERDKLNAILAEKLAVAREALEAYARRDRRFAKTAKEALAKLGEM